MSDETDPQPVSDSVDASAEAPGRVGWLTWVVRVVCVLALLVVAWVLVKAWPVVVHGHPAYAIALGTAGTLALLVGPRAASAWRASRRCGG